MGVILGTLHLQEKTQQESALFRELSFAKQRIQLRFVNNFDALTTINREIVASEEQVVALIERAQRDFGAISCVVNNAGPCLDDAPLEHWHRLVSANLLGTLLVTRHSLDAMQDRGGSIVNIAASVGLGLGAAAQPAYAAAKAGVMRFTAAMRFAHQVHGVRINCLVPDWIATESRLAWLAALSVEQRQTRGVPDVLNTPEQVAQAVLALSQRLDHAGRVVLCRAGQPLQLLPIEDVGYGQLEPF